MEQLRNIPKNQVVMAFVATSIETTARFWGSATARFINE